MELKDVILSTLAEMETTQEEVVTPSVTPVQVQEPKITAIEQSVENEIQESNPLNSDEEKFLQSVRERLLVLFEGFQSPNNKEIEAKVDLTLNFLEYLLSTIDTRLDVIHTKSDN